jgi:methionine-rich copper-binding protein CopC
MHSRVVVAVVVASLAFTLLPATAFAHAEPARVRPGLGAVVTTPPPIIEIEMTQEMARQEGANDIDVFDEAGREVTTVAAAIDNANRKLLSVAMPSQLEAGQYVVRWRTLSADDGDADEGEYAFRYDPNGTADPGQEQLKEEPATPTATATTDGGAAPLPGGGGGGTSWVLVASVAVGMFVLGSGTTFLLVQRRP